MLDKADKQIDGQSFEKSIFRALVENAPSGVILIDEAECVRLFNPACERMFGYSAAEIVGQNVTMLMPARDHHGHDRSLDNFKSVGVGRRKDGSTFSMDLSVGMLKRDGELIFVGIIHDTTEPPSARAMQESDRNYRQLVERVTDYAIYMLDINGIVMSWNSGAQRIKQFTAAEIVGCHYRVFYMEDERSKGEPELNLEIATREGRFEAKGWRRRKDGSQFWANVVIEPLRNESGRLIGFAKVTSDITERREIEQKIREAGERINAVIATIVDGVIQIDKTGNILTVNPPCLKLFGYRIEEVISQNIHGLVVQSGFEAQESYNEVGLRRMIGKSQEVEGRRKDGSVFPMVLSVGEARQDGEPIFVIIIHDLSEHKRTQEQLVQAQKMELVGQLSGGIAHDFNNLLTVIIGNAEFLDEQLDVRQDLKQLAKDIGHAGERGAELTQRLLAFSRRQMLRPIAVDCNGLLEMTQKLLRRTLRADIEIRTVLDPDLILAFADFGQLESAILNLALNAQDALAAGGCLTLTTANASLDSQYHLHHPEVVPGEYVMISVADDGEGMSDKVAERAFEPFYTTKEVGKGSGLGLSMVYGFIKQSNGHVSIHSEPGLGTTIRMYLPQMAAKLHQSPASSIDEGAVPQGTETILVVEDDPFVRSSVVLRLQNLGYSVVTAAAANDALRQLRSGMQIDILFTDIVMPGAINGWELADLAKQIRPGLPVLLTSGYALETLVKRSPLQRGVNILTKPYRKKALALRLREVLQFG